MGLSELAGYSADKQDAGTVAALAAALNLVIVQLVLRTEPAFAIENEAWMDRVAIWSGRYFNFPNHQKFSSL